MYFRSIVTSSHSPQLPRLNASGSRKANSPFIVQRAEKSAWRGAPQRPEAQEAPARAVKAREAVEIRNGRGHASDALAQVNSSRTVKGGECRCNRKAWQSGSLF